MFQHIPDDLVKIITSYAWGKHMTLIQIRNQLSLAEDIQDSVSGILLNSIVFDYQIGQHIPNPFKSTYPFSPIHHIDKNSIWSEIPSLLPNVLDKRFYTRIKSYRSVFARYIDKMQSSGFITYNQVLLKFLIKIELTDFVYEDDNLETIVAHLRRCQALNRQLLSL